MLSIVPANDGIYGQFVSRHGIVIIQRINIHGSVLVCGHSVIFSNGIVVRWENRDGHRGNVTPWLFVVVASVVNAVIDAVIVHVGGVPNSTFVLADDARSVTSFEGERVDEGEIPSLYGDIICERVNKDGLIFGGGDGIVMSDDFLVVACGACLLFVVVRK